MLVLALLLFLAAIGLSPLMLDAYAGSTPDWERRSFIGQTYGAASAILAVLALIGIVITLRLQAHETKLAREEARRSAVGELLKMAMEDPDLDECWGPVPADQDPRARKQQLYVNMIISEWQMSFETGALGATRLRAIAGEMFQGEVGRTFWAEAREIRLATSENPKARRFHEILDEQYHRVRRLDPPPPPPRPGQAAAARQDLVARRPHRGRSGGRLGTTPRAHPPQPLNAPSRIRLTVACLDLIGWSVP